MELKISHTLSSGAECFFLMDVVEEIVLLRELTGKIYVSSYKNVLILFLGLWEFRNPVWSFNYLQLLH